MEGVGFEPTKALTPLRFSRPVQSTALPPLLHASRSDFDCAAYNLFLMPSITLLRIALKNEILKREKKSLVIRYLLLFTFSMQAQSLEKIKSSFEKVDSKDGHYRWFLLGALTFLCFLNYADRQVISCIFPIIERKLSLTKFQLGLISSIFMWAYAACSFFTGFVADRFSRKQLILTSCFFWSVVTVFTSWSTTFLQFIVMRVLQGFIQAVYFPSSISLLADYHDEKSRSTAMGLHQWGVYFGIIVGGALGASIAFHYGWDAKFYFFGGVGMMVSLVLCFMFHEQKCGVSENIVILPERELSSEKDVPTLSLKFIETFHYVFQKPAASLSILAFAGANFVAMIFLIWIPTFLYEKFHFSLLFAGFSGVVFIQVASAISAPCSGWLADRLSMKIKNARIIIQITSLLLGTGAIVAVGKVTSFIPLMISMIAFGFCKGGYDAGIFSSLFDYVEPNIRGFAVGLMDAIGWIGGALGTIIVGALSTYGHGTSMNCMSAAISWSAMGYVVAAGLLASVLVITRSSKIKVNRASY